ncbi:MAG: folate-binding protein [Pseudomonadota bacterium]
MAQPEQPRTLMRISGPDADTFLQNLITQDIGKASGLTYAALLTPQGKYLADFFLLKDDAGFLLDVASAIAPGLAQRLMMYRLRADVAISEADMTVTCGTGTPPPGAFADPRTPDMGWRAYGAADSGDSVDWPALRVAQGIPETGIELTQDSYILEMGFERLNGVDFKKGCYVGQEVTARMKHKTELRKGLAVVALDRSVEPGTDILADAKPVGTIHTVAGDRALAYVRYGRATGNMTAGDATVTPVRNIP